MQFDPDSPSEPKNFVPIGTNKELINELMNKDIEIERFKKAMQRKTNY